jgi:hypothetical protein
MSTYSVFVQFRKDRLTLRRKIATLEAAIRCAELHRASRMDHADEVFVVADETGEAIAIGAEHQTLLEHRRVRQIERFEHAREAAARMTERASRARERAIVACERARTISSQNPFALASTPHVHRLIELTDRAVAGMRRSIVLMEERLVDGADSLSSSPANGESHRTLPPCPGRAGTGG